MVYLYRVLFGESNTNIYMTLHGQFIGDNLHVYQTQNVHFLTVLAFFFYRTDVTEIIK